MPRNPRVFEENCVYHVFNRRTDRQRLFPSASAYEEFVAMVARGRERYNIRISSFCVMETHWHQSIWVRENDGVTAVGKYLRWLSSSHALRFRYASDTRGHGHVYQDRFKSVLVDTDTQYLTLVRYIEANPLVSGLVQRAEEWPWSSLVERLNGRRRIIDDGPLTLPDDWSEIVNARWPADEIDLARHTFECEDDRTKRKEGRRSAARTGAGGRRLVLGGR